MTRKYLTSIYTKVIHFNPAPITILFYFDHSNNLLAYHGLRRADGLPALNRDDPLELHSHQGILAEVL